MADTTFEEAKRCPKCNEPGNSRRHTPAPNQPRGTLLHWVYCENERCEWNNSPWMVQVNPDGTVPQKKDHTGEPKHYVGFEGHEQEARDIVRALEIQKRNQTIPGYEIGRRD